MAKIRHNNILDTVNSILSVSKKKGIIHLHAEDEVLSPGNLTLKGQQVLHFGTCGYLGLEHHAAVKRGAIEAIERFGTQFPMSRTYVSSPLYRELEELVQQIYQAPAVISKNCTLAHLTTIPGIVGLNDMVVLDHQAHASIQDAVKKLLVQGVAVEMIRHSNLEMLEALIKKHGNKYDKIWYMADGVYSMYGDFAPIKEMVALAEKYEQLYLYVDDAHGTSWAGRHGSGYVMSQLEDGRLYRKMVLTANLGKAFGACGGLSLFPNQAWYHKVNNFGGPLTFSVQLEPATLGAAIASARIHLSEEIYTYQQELQNRIAYFKELLRKTDLPLVHDSNSPIFFIGTGTMDTGNYLVQALLHDGIYVNLATFPAVPAKNIGIRITISLNNSFEDIAQLVSKLVANFEIALLATEQTHEKIRKAFKLPPCVPRPEPAPVEKLLKTSSYHTIQRIDEALWNKYLGHTAMFDWEGMRLLERSFSGNAQPENNWKFRYYTITDPQGKLVLMTFAVIALQKEDMFAQVSVSRAIEAEREANPYYLTSKGIILGSLFTEGKHLYLDRNSPYWQQAVKELLQQLSGEQEQEQTFSILLRDFDADDQQMHDLMAELGFVKMLMPETCVVEKLQGQSEEEYVRALSQKGRRHFVQKIKRKQHFFEPVVKIRLSPDELDYAIKLFKNVKNHNFAINSFLFPEKLFQEINESEHWEFLILYIREEYSINRRPVAVCFNHINANRVYSPMLIGMDYDYLLEYGVYRQSLFEVIRRALALGCRQINFGISATIEKKRIGAAVYQRVGYYQAKDNFTMEMMGATFAVDSE